MPKRPFVWPTEPFAGPLDDRREAAFTLRKAHAALRGQRCGEALYWVMRLEARRRMLRFVKTRTLARVRAAVTRCYGGR